MVLEGGIHDRRRRSIRRFPLEKQDRADELIDLIDHGVEDLHFYTINRADLVFAICHLIGLRAKPNVAAEAA